MAVLETGRRRADRLAAVIREQFGLRWTALAKLVLLVASGAVTIAEFAGVAAGGEP